MKYDVCIIEGCKYVALPQIIILNVKRRKVCICNVNEKVLVKR
jgi:molybdopterin-guanine dinucleotide biosynthesis protein